MVNLIEKENHIDVVNSINLETQVDRVKQMVIEIHYLWSPYGEEKLPNAASLV